MDIKEYIESGILETYVMGHASEQEQREVQQYAAAFPEIRRELSAIEETLGKYAAQHQKTPPPELKEKIMSRISPQQNHREAKIIDISTAKQIEKESGSGFSFGIAAAITLLIISAAGNYILYNKWQKAYSEVIALNNEKTILAQQLQVEKTNYDLMNRDMAILKQPFNKVVAMKGLEVSPSSLATVYWNEKTKEVFLNVNSLPAPPVGKQYQLWALMDGKPIDAGMLDLNDTAGIHKMKTIESAQAFAVTLEKTGGGPKPEGAMYVMGNI
ncbi:MAG: anti-sigma factor [Bacteroidota bacterium]